jgi:hypothetical protein
MDATAEAPVSKRDGSTAGRSAKLRATAARFRVVAENSFDPTIVAAVHDFVKDLESEAALLEAPSTG